MLVAKAVLLLAVAFVALTRVAGAQTAPEPAARDAEERSAAPVERPRLPTLEASPAPRLRLADASAWLREYVRDVPTSPASLVTFAPQPLLAGPRAPAPPRNPLPRGIPSIHGRLLPIPMLQWRARAPLDSRASLAFRPSLVIGRRRTYMPEVFRGSRTFGFALQVRINVGQPAPAPAQEAPAGASGTAQLASRARALMSVVR
jgi:hypothetical protein